MRAIPQAAIDLISRWEGLRLEAYPDPATGGEPWTIGYGHTGGVKPGEKISPATARRLLKEDLARFALAIEGKVGGIVYDLTENQYAALLSLIFNVGPEAPKTLFAKLKRREFEQIPAEFLRFVNANGRKMQGLVNRRTDEIRVWSMDEPGSDDVAFTSGALRTMDTPPTPTDPTPARKSVSIWTAISAPFVTAGAALMAWIEQAPDWLKQAINIVNPFSQQSGIVQHMVAGLATTAAVVGVVNAVLQARKKGEARR